MKIVLIALYDFYSIGIRGLHSYVQVQGYDVTSIYFKESTYTDGAYNNNEIHSLIVMLKELKPDFVGVGIRSPIFPMHKNLHRAIREELPDCKIVVGGAHATGDPEGSLEYADYVVVGDGELAFVDILKGHKPGILGPVQFTDLDSLPFQYYGRDTYALGKPKPCEKMSVYTTRGCPFNCSYCQESLLTRKIVRKSVKYFKEETAYYRTVVPDLTHMTLTDPNFLWDADWFEEFAKEFSGSGLTFWCAGHANTVTPEILKMAKAAGIVSIRIGVQSGSNYVRKYVYNRKESLESILTASEMIEAAEITGQYDFIIDSPFDTPDSLKATRRFITRLPNSAMINKFELRFWPGTEITRKALDLKYIEPEDVEGNFVRLGNWVYLYRMIGG